MSYFDRSLFLKPIPEERTRNINVWFVGCISALIHSCLGVLLAPVFFLAFLATGLHEQGLYGNGTMFTIAFPAGYALVGFVVGAAAAYLYNKLACHLFRQDAEQPASLKSAA